MHRRVYVTGPLEGATPQVMKNHRTNLDLVCRRILIAGDVPICPILFTHDWQKDPRFSKKLEWWIDNVFKIYMIDCEIFCYVPTLVGVKSDRMELEKNLWKVIGDGKFFIADRILDILTRGTNASIR